MSKQSNKSVKPSMKAKNGKKSTTSAFVQPVVQMTDRGRRIKKYASISEAAASTGVNSGTISRVVRGIGQTAGGFRWMPA
jgi:hypothetical protein